MGLLGAIGKIRVSGEDVPGFSGNLPDCVVIGPVILSITG
jgi:hypothetical protein